MRLVFCAALLLASSGVSAQTVNILSGPRSSALQPTRVQVQVGITSSRASSTAEDQLAVQESLRRSLYEYAAKECGVIGETFKSECRMSSLNITSNAGQRGGSMPDLVSANASATFELTPKPAN